MRTIDAVGRGLEAMAGGWGDVAEARLELDASEAAQRDVAADIDEELKRAVHVWRKVERHAQAREALERRFDGDAHEYAGLTHLLQTAEQLRVAAGAPPPARGGGDGGEAGGGGAGGGGAGDGADGGTPPPSPTTAVVVSLAECWEARRDALAADVTHLPGLCLLYAASVVMGACQLPIETQWALLQRWAARAAERGIPLPSLSEAVRERLRPPQAVRESAGVGGWGLAAGLHQAHRRRPSSLAAAGGARGSSAIGAARWRTSSLPPSTRPTPRRRRARRQVSYTPRARSATAARDGDERRSLALFARACGARRADERDDALREIARLPFAVEARGAAALAPHGSAGARQHGAHADEPDGEYE